MGIVIALFVLAVSTLFSLSFAVDAIGTHSSKAIITSDKTTYIVGETVYVKGWVSYQDRPTSYVFLDVRVISPDGKESEESIRSDSSGNFVFDFLLPNDASLGKYIVEIISQCREVHRDICTNQSTRWVITVTEEALDMLTISSLKFVDSSRLEEVDTATNGETILIRSEVAYSNNDDTAQKEFTEIVQVKDSSGITVMLSWSSDAILSNDSLTLDTPWTPDTPGDYSIEVYLWSDITTAIPLVEPVKSGLVVVG